MLRDAVMALLVCVGVLSIPVSEVRAQVPTEPGDRAAFIEADRAALLERIHPRWRDFQPQWRDEVCPFGRTAKYDPEKVSCGYVLVPENRRKPDSRLIRIAVSKVKSIAEGEPPAGPTVLLEGGPGGPAAESAAYIFPDRIARHRAWLELGDLYLVDQRGVGYSEAPLCRGLWGQSRVPSSLEGLRQEAQRIRACFEEARSRGIDPDAYATWDNALDIRDIRRALGFETWNIWGTSYGTELGQMILRVDGEGVRAAVLDSVVAPKLDGGGWRLWSDGFLSAIGKLNEACAADQACARRYGNLEALTRKAVEAYEAAPHKIEGLDPEAFEDGELVIGGPVVARAIFQVLYRSRYYPALPAVIEALAERRADGALPAYVDTLAQPPGHDFGLGMHHVASCAGFASPSPDRIATQAERQPFWSAVFLEAFELENCESSGHFPADPLVSATPLVTDRPVLLLVGDADPITPPYMAEAVKASLPKAAYVVAPWVGHYTAGEDCIGAKIMPAFLANPTAAPDTSCLAEMKPTKFVIDYKKSTGPFDLYRAYRDGKATGPLIWLSVCLATLAFAAVAFPMGVVARKVDRCPVTPAGGARRAAVAAALLSLVGAGLLGSAVMSTLREHLLLAPLGLVGPAQLGVWLILAGAAAGIAAITLLVRANTDARLPIGTSLGVLSTGAAALALATFVGVHGLI